MELQGHGEPCYYCGKPTDSLAGNPGLWPLPFAHRDEPGVVKWHHTQCVTARLVENVERDARGRTELDDWRQAAEVEASARREFHDEAARLRSALNAPLSSDEMRLVDKHCDWIAFQHAWNAVMKARRTKAGDPE